MKLDISQNRKTVKLGRGEKENFLSAAVVSLTHLLAPGLKYKHLFYCVICVSEPLLGDLQAKQEEKLLFTADSH